MSAKRLAFLLAVIACSLASTFAQDGATPVAAIKVLPGFEVELLYSVPMEEQGSWVAMTFDEKHPDKETLRQGWMATDGPMAARAGWSLTAERVVNSPERLDLTALLDRIESQMGNAAP